ncbi:MAG: hypothetical protein L6Q95_01515 [Planctomycetes bacterium]|nr:hypothetical protein [Planctomycetota bacterium]
MLLGFSLLYDTVGTTPYYTTPFARRGLAALFSIQTTHVRGALTLNAVVQHKNREDTSWSNAGSFSGITALGLSSLDVTSLKEEIRFAFTFSGAGSLGHFFRVFIPPPAWRPYS